MADNYEVLDQIIVGRVTPHIYAFTTNTVPSYLKVGDTYRPVATRLREWERHFPGLSKEYEAPATVNDDIYFRDFAVHRFLEQARHRARLTPDILPDGVYFSREFFKGASLDDVKDAISDIHHDFEEKNGHYEFYDATSQLPQPFRYKRGATWTLRPNQQETVDNFVKAVKSGRTNLLMYAVMRFGKSFTSLCCANAIKAKTILVVSAKADVRSEWKKTVETAGNFDGWVFVDQETLALNEHILDKRREAGLTTVVFLTLQDLQGKQLKEKHRQVFTSDLDLLIVDETHFGARAEEYGRVLRDVGQPTDPTAAQRRDLDEHVDANEANEQLKQLSPRIRLHLSGTPYRILMGSEFEPGDIISFVQFSDIVREQEAWDAAHLDDDDTEEWDNPYFGFPQMIRFAFTPNESSRKKMAELRKSGISFAFSALLEPRSIRQDNKTKGHRKFKYEDEILDLMRVIDGSKQDENLLGFLDYDKIKEGQMCRHMVMVLPYCASCDAMEQLINDHKDEFKNLGEYKIINISGVEGGKDYKNPEAVKKTIADAEADRQKTLTLTVNRMLTGSTVEQWDSMLYLKDTSSPQEYDQAIFRLQNQYTRTLESPNGDDIKENLKPQTLLVDFDPGRMFHMQEQKSLIYNVNTDYNGNDKLEERLEEELRISPIITMNHNKIHRVEATNILDAVSSYNNQRSIADEARDTPVDLGLLDNSSLRAVIEKQPEIGSRQGLTIPPNEGEEDEPDGSLDTPDDGGPEDAEKPDPPNDSHSGKATEEDIRTIERKLQTYYQRILFFAMLSPQEVRSLQDVIDVIDDDETRRIARNLGLEVQVLSEMIRAFDPFKLSALDYKIQNISHLGRDESLPPVERASRALAKFTRISDSEVRTPQWLCEDMVDLIPGDELASALQNGQKILDIASKSGEFAVATYQRLINDLGVNEELAQNAIYSIPTSSIAYEFTKRFYEILGLNVDNISLKFTSYELLQTDANGDIDTAHVGSTLRQNVKFADLDLKDQTTKEVQVEFAAVVGNPPYQKADNQAGKGSAQPIYQQFVELATSLKPSFVSMVTPSVWFVGGKGLDNFRSYMMSTPHLAKLTHFVTSQDVFPQVNLRGGVSYFLLDKQYDNRVGRANVTLVKDGSTITSGMRSVTVQGLDYFIPDNVAAHLLNRLIEEHSIRLDESSPDMFSSVVSPRNPYGLATTFPHSQKFHLDSSNIDTPIRVYASHGRKGFIEQRFLEKHED